MKVIEVNKIAELNIFNFEVMNDKKTNDVVGTDELPTTVRAQLATKRWSLLLHLQITAWSTPRRRMPC